MVFSQTGTIGVSVLFLFSCFAEIKQTQTSKLQMYKILKRMYGVLGEYLCLAEPDLVFIQVWNERQGGCYPVSQSK